jgi:hypothetical protein
LVNGQGISLCTDVEGECRLKYKGHIGLGSQNWPQHTLYCEPLGDGELAPKDRTLQLAEALNLIIKNHNDPLQHDKTAQWVKDAVFGVPKPKEKTGEC